MFFLLVYICVCIYDGLLVDTSSRQKYTTPGTIEYIHMTTLDGLKITLGVNND